MKCNFFYFSPPTCHRHTISLCMAGTGDRVDGVVTCYRLDSQIWTPVGARHFLFLLPVWTSPGAHPAVFTLGNGPLNWEYSSQSMELITHPNLMLILRISRAIPLLFLCATIGMLWSDLYPLHMLGWLFSRAIPLLPLCATIGMFGSDLYLLHMRGWLFMNSVFMY